MNLIGKTIHGYKIQKRIGQGGMGSVYLAKHTTLEKELAIKVVNLESENDSEMALRFKREAKLHARLGRHSNIIELENYIAEDHHYIFMEYFKSVELATVIGKQTGPMPHERAMPIFKQILSGIGHTHDAGIIHRDIKPPNILINKKDGIKIADYGIAIESSGKMKMDKMGAITQKGVVVGSPTYMSPEQILAMDLDYSTDIYLLGITFYEILAGRPPFDPTKLSITEIKKAHINTIPEDPRKYYPDIPENIVNAVMMALNKNQSDRQRFCKEFLSNLEGRSKVSVVPTKKPSAPKKKSPEVKKNGPQQLPPNDSGVNSVLKWVGGLVVLILGLIMLNEFNNSQYDTRTTSDSSPSSQTSKPFDVNACYKKGKKYYDDELWDKAIQQFSSCLLKEPSHEDTRFMRAKAYFKNYKNKSKNKHFLLIAESDATTLVDKTGNDRRDHKLRAYIRFESKNWQGAIFDFDKIIEMGENDPIIYMSNGKSKYENADYKDGENNYDKAILEYKSMFNKRGSTRLKRELAEAYYGKALCMGSMQRPNYRETTDELQNAIDYYDKSEYRIYLAEKYYEWSKKRGKGKKKDKACEQLEIVKNKFSGNDASHARELMETYKCD